MKTIQYNVGALKRILLMRRFPKGNTEYLIQCSWLDYNHSSDGMRWDLRVSLPDDHWAFTQQEEPQPRYWAPTYSSTRGYDVFDRESGSLMATFPVHCRATDYVDFLNNREVKP